VSLITSESAPATTWDGRIIVAVWPQYASFPDWSPERMPVPPFDVDAKVDDGKFEFETFPDSVFIVHRLEIDGKVRHVLDNRPAAVKQGEEWQVRADSRLVRAVHVVASEDQSDVKQVLAIRADKYGWHPDPRTTQGPTPANSPTPPSEGGFARVVWDAPARFELALLDAVSTSLPSVGLFWIRAPHRKWRKVVLDFEGKDELKISLERAAELVVDLSHASAKTGYCILVYPGSQYSSVDEWHADAERLYVVKSTSGEGLSHAVFDPIPAGEYVVIAEVSEGNSQVAVFGRVTVVDGEVANLKLDLQLAR
jgi:hypothetical protein